MGKRKRARRDRKAFERMLRQSIRLTPLTQLFFDEIVFRR
jgi:hypothetical protein